MRALILAASRRQPVSLAGTPLIVRQIAALRAGGADEIGVLSGDAAQTSSMAGVTYFDTEPETGAVTSLTVAAGWLRSGPVLVSNGNVFYRRELVHALGSVRGSFVLAYDRRRDLWTRRFGDPFAHAETFRRSPAGNLLEIGGKAIDLDTIQGRSIGLLKLTPNGWGPVETLLAGLDQPTRHRLDITGLLQRLLAANTLSIGTVGTDGQWGEIDGPADVALYERLAETGELTLEG